MTPEAPSFAGLPGEVVDVYISLCKFYWAGRGLTADELHEARGATLRGGLTGAAAAFASTLDTTVQLHFGALSERLKKQFPFKRRPLNDHETINKLMTLRQGEKTLDDYCEEAMTLKQLLSANLDGLLAHKWAAGLVSEEVAEEIFEKLFEWGQMDPQQPNRATKFLDITRAIHYARFPLSSTGYEEPDPLTDVDLTVVSLQKIIDLCMQ